MIITDSQVIGFQHNECENPGLRLVAVNVNVNVTITGSEEVYWQSVVHKYLPGREYVNVVLGHFKIRVPQQGRAMAATKRTFYYTS